MIDSRVPRAVGVQPRQHFLGKAFFEWPSQYRKPKPLRRIPAMNYYWNAGVNMAYGRPEPYPVRSGGDTGLKPGRRRKRGWLLRGEPEAEIGVEAYNRAQSYMLYGSPHEAQHELGDLFNDIMGAVVPGWEKRPEALKKIRLKADPNKIMQAAQRVAPNLGADVVRAANANGMQVYVQTPGGEVNVSPETAQLYYGNYQFLTRAQDLLGRVSDMPQWIWYVAGAGVLAMVLMKK